MGDEEGEGDEYEGSGRYVRSEMLGRCAVIVGITWTHDDGDATATRVQASARCAVGDPLRRKVGVARKVEGKVKIYSERKLWCSHPYLTIQAGVAYSSYQ